MLTFTVRFHQKHYQRCNGKCKTWS